MNIIRKAFNRLLPYFQSNELEELWDIKVCILDKKTKQPIGGAGYTIEFYDEDALDVDFLGEGVLNPDGIADVRFNPKLMNSGYEDSDIPETNPDIFFIIKKDGEEIFKSVTTFNIDYSKNASFDIEEGKEFHLGTFLIDIE
ncbi:MAG: hypothetical protein LC107_00470 [Chitinophagales bacterium]|nr:hypothetical protein [Chitinophagales bacterium]